MFFYTFLSFINHWKKNPLQLLLLLIGLSIGTALWSGVQALNFVAKKSYNEATSLIFNNQKKSIISNNKEYFNEDIFYKLRRNGIPVTPILEGKFKKNIKVIGFDPISSFERNNNKIFNKNLKFDDFFEDSYSIISNSKTAKRLENLQIFKNIFILESLPENTILADISLAQILLNKKGLLSKLEIEKNFLVSEKILIEKNLKIISFDQSLNFKSITKSFHLNLTAFGFLSFLVGLFIVNSTINLSLTQRKKLFKTLNAIGISKNFLLLTFVFELIFLSLIGSFIGMILGYFFATFLLPDMSSTITGLFGARIENQITVSLSWWIVGICLPIIGTILVSSSSIIEIKNLKLTKNSFSYSWVEISKNKMRLKLILSLIIILLIAFIFFTFNNLFWSFILLGLTLILFSLLLPIFLWFSISFMQSKFKGNTFFYWFLSDTKKQTDTLSISLMALLIALSVNIGVGGMVGSFRTTFHSWLDQRLVSELYLKISHKEKEEEILSFLNTETDAVLPIVSKDYSIFEKPVEIYGFKPHETYENHWPLIKKTDDAWRQISKNNGGILINEQAFRKLKLDLNSQIKIRFENSEKTLKVLAIYSDYGNPKAQMMLPLELFFQIFPNSEVDRYALRIKKNQIKYFEKKLIEEFNIKSEEILNQDELKKLSKSIFEKTFKVSNALSTLTLIVAGIAIFTSLTSIGFYRLGEIAPIWAIGFSSKTLAILEIFKAILLTFLTSLLSIPLGNLVTYILTNFVNVSAFGWKLPIFIFPSQWIYMMMVSIFITLFAVFFPSYKLWKANPNDLLRKFNENI